MENPSFKTTHNGELSLEASRVAQHHVRAPAVMAKKPEEVEAEARARVVSEGGDPGNLAVVLSRTTIQFGMYQGQTFLWLLENDVGYMVNMVASHQKEREHTGSQSALMANKDALTRYSSAYGEFMDLVRFHRAFESAKERSLLPGQEGLALVGFGQYKSETLQDLYQSKDPKTVRYVSYIRKTPAKTKMQEDVARYVCLRDRRERAAAGRRSPSDAELVQVSVDTEQSLEVQARALLHPPPATAGPVMARAPVADGAELLPPIRWRAALTVEQQKWIGRAMFTRGSTGRSQLVDELCLWWTPPQPRPIYHQPPTSPDLFFPCRLFLWMPHRIWHIRLTCPQPQCAGSLTKAGLYKTIRRVLDIDGWYLMATEYLECPVCKKKVAGWSQGIIRQLPPTYSCQFPAVLAYKLSCDLRVVCLLKSRTLGNSATRLAGTLKELHAEAWMRKSTHYLGVCDQFLALGERRQFLSPPPMPPVPSPAWLLAVYCQDVMSRLDDCKARITSTFGSILKLDSTKKMTKKLAGAASQTAAWVANVGNEHGQVIMSVLTSVESVEGLSPMAAGLMRRYRDAEVPPPQLIYVDRDCCCLEGGVSATDAMFPDWGQLVVRLDIWHLMRRFAAGVTTESHELYPTFMRQLSHCIFEVDSEDARRLTDAKRCELEGKHGMVGLGEAEVRARISLEEWARHCRRRTRGVAETERLIQELLDTFGSHKGQNTLGIPLLDSRRIHGIWSSQRRHLHCIQDPPGVQLYRQTGTLTKESVYPCFAAHAVPYRWSRSTSTSTGSSQVNALHFQAFLVDGLVRWNEDRAAAAAAPPAAEEEPLQPLCSYSGHLKHVLNLNSLG